MSAAEQYIGSQVLVTCGFGVVYDGIVFGVNEIDQTITLMHCVRNGALISDNVTINAKDITDLKIVHDSPVKSSDTSSIISGSKKVGTDNILRHRSPISLTKPSSVMTEADLLNQLTVNAMDYLKSSHQKSPRTRSGRQSSNSPAQFLSGLDRKSFRKKDALEDPLDLNLMQEDFDFEGNLALFRKIGSKPTQNADAYVLPVDRVSPVKKNYRHDENVLNDPASIYQKPKGVWSFKDANDVLIPSTTVVNKKAYLEAMNNWSTHSTSTFIFSYSLTICECILNFLCQKNSKNVKFCSYYFGKSSLFFQIQRQITVLLKCRGYVVSEKCEATASDSNFETKEFEHLETVLIFLGKCYDFGVEHVRRRIFIECDWPEYKTSNLEMEHSKIINSSSGQPHEDMVIFWQIPVHDCQDWLTNFSMKFLYVCDVANVEESITGGLTNFRKIAFGASFIKRIVKA